MIRGLIRLALGLSVVGGLFVFYNYADDQGILDTAKEAFSESYSNEANEAGSPLKDIKEKGLRDGLAGLVEKGKTNQPTPGTKSTRKQARRALKTVDALPVKGRAPKTGYDRDQFGSEWSDAAGDFAWSRNGLDTRNDLLSRDLSDVECKAKTTSKTGSCKVLSGVLAVEPYTGARDVKFIAGGAYENGLDAEHLVALGDAWQKGAQGWSAEKRAAFANDPINLLAVDPSSNRSKGDSDIATWLPPNKAYRCAYAAAQAKVKKRYGLWVTKAEKAAMVRVLTPCSK